jgi:hypothetical protein
VFDDMLKKPCPYHKTPVNHTLEQCDMLKKFYGRAAAKDAEAKKDGGDGDAGGFPAVENVFLIFGGPTGILQRCVPIPEGRELLWDIHTGICGHHAAPRTLVGNAFRQGFYWPTAVADASEIVRTCEGCQFYARKSNLPAHVLQTIPITWPFAV